ncbi:MAG: Maf family protein [bacterium]|nr:Maf family protein [bacterium]
MKIVLGSASSRRKTVLKEMGYKFEVVTADIDEKTIRRDDSKELVLAIANAKSDALLPKVPNDALLITADTVVLFEGRILEKPQSEEDAYSVLESYKDKFAQVITAVVVTNTTTGKRSEGVDTARISFEPMPRKIVKDFVESKRALEGAGSFVINDPLIRSLVRKIEGTFDSIMGLPKNLVQKLIDQVSK